MTLPKIFWLSSARNYLKVAHVHTGFDDRCLFWYSHGKVMDVMFIKIIK